MYIDKIIRNKTTADKLQEVILNYAILFHENNRNNGSAKNTSIKTFVQEVLDNLSTIYSLVNLYRSELDIKTDITEEIREIVFILSQREYNLKDEEQRNQILIEIHLLIDLIRHSFESNQARTYICVVPGCNHTAISSHTISRENNFTKGVDFYRFREKKYNDGLDEAYELMKVSDKKLSTHPLFCRMHDRQIFLPIENGKKINPFNQKHLFLQNWRTFTLHHSRTKDKKDIFMETVLGDASKTSLVNSLNITDYMNSLDGKIYRKLSPKVDYLAMNFTLNNTPLILASVILDIKHIAPEFTRNNTPFFNETVNFFYIHILHNGGAPIVNISAFNDDINYQAMMHMYSLYQSNPQLFWNKILQFISTSSNIFFNGSIIYPNGDQRYEICIFKKIQNLYSEIHQANKDIYVTPDYYKQVHVKFSKKEINTLFAHNAFDCNFI